MRQCWSVNFIWCRSLNFIWFQSLTYCMRGYMIYRWLSIVWQPKNSICGYAECARAKRTMVVDAILQTRVPLESWKNKDSFLYRTIWKKFLKKSCWIVLVAARGYRGCNRFYSRSYSFQPFSIIRNAPVRTFSIRQPCCKLTWNGGLKNAILTNFMSIRACRTR